MAFKRAVANKLKIIDLLKGSYTAGGSIENPNKLELEDGREVTRVNVVGTVADRYENKESNFSSVMIGDETGKIKVKFFEEPVPEGIKEGGLVKVIGKIRESGDERFILGEAIKNIENQNYPKLRELEIREIRKRVEKNRPEKGEAEEEKSVDFIEDAGAV
ncbi:MAG: OB-fold nucleic acid binding domain-containing protein [Candidatus Micrarchaeota archaeon]